MMIEVLYFAWVREGVGKAQERVDPPAEVKTVSDLIDWLRHEVLADKAKLRAAIDQRFVPLDAPITGAREVAIFPPVTGG
ncbi:MAG: molybdopterin converting factor subunit 1 [Sphingomonas sp.]|uniref:molybdopterin converting factor subunit 1 n=1 Tax=Sphingomonas sp. TaxID=28214 RepID=UPI0012034B27|nr:molybdopterin converting factor subunit 1 [Sphingomonas sp.]THD35472.1 MAG: molybdopterin converting factor subunit 1 [Sphingomonas sp.]